MYTILLQVIQKYKSSLSAYYVHIEGILLYVFNSLRHIQTLTAKKVSKDPCGNSSAEHVPTWNPILVLFSRVIDDNVI